MEYTLQELKTITILYVEDEEQIRETIFRTFEKLFKKVYLGCDGQEGIDIFNENKDEIEIIVTDINMPRINGIEMISSICSVQTLPVVVTTAHTDEKYLLKAIELNVDKYVTKPIKVKELTNIIAKLVFEDRKSRKRTQATVNLLSKTKEMQEEKKQLQIQSSIIQKELTLLRSLADNYISIIKTDKNGIIKEVSTKFIKLYGYTEDEIIGKNISTIQHEKRSNSEIQKYMLEIIHTKQSMSTVHDFETKSGVHLECDMTMHPHYGSDGYINGYSFYQDLIHI